MILAKPRILFAGTSSGCGKTTAVCAVLKLLTRRGVAVSAAKCGPDYIDPMFHEAVLGIPSSNLDPFFCGGNLLRAGLARSSGDLCVVEGVMGYYDGTGADGMENSTCTAARETGTPVILVVNGRGAYASLLALIEGFLNYVPESGIRGVLFSNVTAMTYAGLKKMVEARFGGRIVPVGYIPRLPETCEFTSRRLGLVTASEIADLGARLGEIADLCEKTVDLDAVLALAESAAPLEFDPPEIRRHPPVTIALAHDEAFCFVYPDTLRLLEDMGAALVRFSPLKNEAIPDSADGLLLPGGYPELHTEQLEANEAFRESVRRAVCSGMPTIAECGGFQVLGERLAGRKMCGVLPHDSSDAGRLVRFGYCTLTAQSDGLLGPRGTALPAHEFHYYDSTDCGSDFEAVKPNGKSWACAVHTETLYAGYPHLCLSACPGAAESFYKKCLAYKEKKI